jgi:hypothetical protein
MKINYRLVIPALAVALTASAAIAQLPGDGAHERVLPVAANPGPRAAQFCDDMKARQAARFTFIEERLKLTTAQKPLFDRWKSAVESVAADRQANCGKARPGGEAAARPSLPERNTRMEERLKTRLADLEKTRGPQEALYNALSEDQKTLFERGQTRGRFGMRANFRRHMDRGFGGRGFGRPGFGRGPAGPGMNRGPGANSPT